MEAIFYIMFVLVIGMFVFVFVKNISEWHNNNNSPRLTVDATIVDKRMATHHHHHNGHTTHSHSYYVTFQVQSGDRMELKVPRSEYGILVAGDIGVLSFQGTRYLGFERKIES